MIVSESAPSTSMIVQGIKVSVPIFVTDESFIGSAEPMAAIGFPIPSLASVVQQTLVENIRNNTAPAVTKEIASVLAAAGVESWDGKIASLDDEQKKLVADGIDNTKVQGLVNTYIAAYTPGVRRASSAEPIDPVESLARKLAKQAIQDRLEQMAFTYEGQSFSGVGRTARAESFKAFDAYCQETHSCSAAEFIDGKVDENVEKVPYFTEQAERQVAEAAEASKDLKLSI